MLWSVEQLDFPEYKGKPVIVGGKPEDKRGVVSTCSYEARKFGVHSAMPIFKAVKLCPNGIYLRGRMKRYQEKSKEVMSIFYNYSPEIMQISIDEASYIPVYMYRAPNTGKLQRFKLIDIESNIQKYDDL